MNEKARVRNVKSMLEAGELPTEREFEQFLRDAGFSRTMAKQILSVGFKAVNQRDADEEEVSAEKVDALLKILKGEK
jgi:hypothetical protein